jgi:pilus assembly protein CpaC
VTDQLPLPAMMTGPRRGSARVWCGVALVCLVGATTATAQTPPPPSPSGGAAAPTPRLIVPSPPSDTPPPPPAPGDTPAPAPGAVGAATTDMPNDLITEVTGPKTEIFVVVGQSKLVEAKRPFKRVVIANPAIADVQLLDADQPNPTLLNIYGRLFGTTSLALWDIQDRMSTFIVRVTIDTKELSARIKAIFPGAEVSVRQLGTQIILEGQVPDSKTMAEVLQLVTTSLLGNAPGAPSAGGAPAVSGGGGAGGAAPAGASSTGTSSTSSTGSMGSSMQTQAAPAGVGGGTILPPGTIINRVHVPGPRQVMLHVKIAELNRTALRQIGVSWLDTRNRALIGSNIAGAGTVSAGAGLLGGTTIPLGQTGSFVPATFTQGQIPTPGFIQPVASTFASTASVLTSGTSNLFGIFNAGQFNIFINALRQNQLAKILAEPNLMTLDGQPARFIAGGSFPFPVPQGTSAGGVSAITIQFRDFGAILQFLPTILGHDVIRLDVEPSFSELNPATGVTVQGTTVPGINQRSARTVVELREGQTLAIAGLLQTRSTGTSARIPGLGDLPVVGPLFSHTDFTLVETELVVLVTPELVAPMEKGEVPPGPGDRVLPPNDWEFYFLGRIEGKTGHNFRPTVMQFDPLEVMKHFQCENQWVVGPHGHAD